MTDQLLKGLPDYGRELFGRFQDCANGMPADAVISAAVNVLIFALRQSYGKRDRAEARFDELLGIAKTRLLNYYDPVVNQRRSNMGPYTQVVRPPLMVDPEMFAPGIARIKKAGG